MNFQDEPPNFYELKKAGQNDPAAADVLGDYYEEQGKPNLAKDWRKTASSIRLEAEHPTLVLERIRLDRGGYQAAGFHRGKYFGIGAPLFFVYDEDSGGEKVSYHLRARDRRDAIAKVELKYPEAKIRGGSLKHRKGYKRRRVY